MNEHHDIVIVGGGLAGLTLARVLHVNGVKSLVLEAETTRGSRSQGGMLDIHEESGQAAIKAADLYEQFLGLYHQGGEQTRVVDKHAIVHLDNPDTGQRSRPEINREWLRDMLIDSIPETAVRWGSWVPRVESLGDGSHVVHLEDGNTITTDLLVGADGAWSNVRPLLSEAVPAYDGITFVEAHVSGAAASCPDGADVIGAGMLFALDEEKGILAHSAPGDELHIYFAFKVPETWADTVADMSDPEAARAVLDREFSAWHSSMRSLIAQADAPFIPRKIHALPIGHSWNPVPGVTLVGDAAHVMSPFAGEGANIAMQDGHLLAEALLGHPDSIADALVAYETPMFERAEALSTMSSQNAVLCMAPDAAPNLVAAISGFIQDAPDSVPAG